MTEIENKHHLPLPFMLKVTVFFLLADGLFKLTAVLFGITPGPEILGYYNSRYFYALVAIVDFSIAVQIFFKAYYVWILGFVFFLLQIAVLVVHFVIISPHAWLGPDVLGRIQIVLSIILYSVFAVNMLSRTVRRQLSP